MLVARITRRELLLGSGAGLITGLVAGCQGGMGMAEPTAVNPLIKPKVATGVDVTAVLASSELALGRNRFVFGLIDPRNQPIGTGAVHVDFFKVQVQSGTAQKRTEAEATFRMVAGTPRGVWVAAVDLDEVGPWGAQTVLQMEGQSPMASRLSFDVRQAFSAPGYGAPAIRSKTPTRADVNGETARICSATPPCDLHEISLDAALAAGDKPVVVAFATPGFCASATCAPQLNEVLRLRAAGYQERAHFVHVEIYQAPFEQRKNQRAVDEWKLPSEPWVFVIDRDSSVRDRFEGAAPADEMEPSLRGLV